MDAKMVLNPDFWKLTAFQKRQTCKKYIQYKILNAKIINSALLNGSDEHRHLYPVTGPFYGNRCSQDRVIELKETTV